jgi:predicted outer membrane repeat protein
LIKWCFTGLVALPVDKRLIWEISINEKLSANQEDIQMKKKLMPVIITLLLASACQADIITVDDDGPADFNNIQQAIDDANDGDTVLVADGIYTGPGNRDIDFLGRAITLRSENGPKNCIIDCQGSEAHPHRGFSFHSGEGPNSILSGFTITNGWANQGGAIFCQMSSPRIQNNILSENCALGNNTGFGGGIGCWESSATITGNVITNNYAEGRGGGIFSDESSLVLVNNIIEKNNAFALSGFLLLPGMGGGIDCQYSSLVITNNTISDNRAHQITIPEIIPGEGGGIHCLRSSLTILNTILWNDAPDETSFDAESTVNIAYSNIQGGRLGQGNIDADPCFTNPNNGDHHLKSQAGRWEPSTQVWIQDGITSLCIDAGDPMSPIGLEPFPNGGIINLGSISVNLEWVPMPPFCYHFVIIDNNGEHVWQ